MEKLKDKYLVRPISYKGLERIESLEYPEPALREAILNAIIHKDYSSTWIFLRVMDDRLEIWNPGTLPDELTIEKLKGNHSSYPRNRNIADIFFRAGYIESWGRGTNKIIDTCVEAGLPEPAIQEYEKGINVTFWKDIYNEEYLKKSGLSERQVKAVIYAKENGRITNKDYQELNKVSKATATRDLQELLEKMLLKNSGLKGAGAGYIIGSFGP
jgi:ATP-dependent DNA helicase RecG